MRIHAVHKLIDSRKKSATKPFNARGAKVERCLFCQIDIRYCICQYQPDVDTKAAVLILMSENEVLKPSNTGRLIADVVKETYCYQWSRTEPAPELIALLLNPAYEPIVIFPEEYVDDSSRVFSSYRGHFCQTRKPLLIFLDGSWREARRIFRKSPYLSKLPVFSIKPEKISEYVMRKSENDQHLATAEVASLVLKEINETKAGDAIDFWFELFRESYLLSKTRMKKDLTRPALRRYLDWQKNAATFCR